MQGRSNCTQYLDLLGHSLGVNVYHAKRSKSKKDKKLPKEFYRNRFCAGADHDQYEALEVLEKQGLMKREIIINQGQSILWCVTSDGIEKFRAEYEKYIQ